MMSARAQNPSSEQRLDEIDGLRAIAMTMVIAQHCGIAPFGWTGVWLFYCISGFVITRRLVQENRAHPPISGGMRYLTFIYRRFFRIIPVYLLYLGLASSLLLLARQTESIRNIPFLLTFTFNWQAIFQFWPAPDGPFGPLWTLSVEEQFYLVFPLLFLLLPRRQFLAVATILIAAGPAIRHLMSATLYRMSPDPGFVAFGVYASSFTQFDAFLMGALVACHESWLRTHPKMVQYFSLVAAVAMLAYVAAYIGINISNGARGVDILRNIVSGVLWGNGRETVLYTALDLIWISAIMWTLIRPKFLRPLAWPALVLVGRVSYGGYLYHALVLWVLFSTVIPADAALAIPSRLLLFVVVWCITVTFASITYHWFEMPIMAWANRRLRQAPRRMGDAT
ncbi:peptidoglycan/LPS O-acetylase OafA/YrhL [Ancylobacter sp. 3268]|uniref:acyltransferase family protein n=1 Tax=Ancylobacter sp. 3268 TaxID=2817752 RepID=UPI00285DBCC0|nr:acyltransferase [Ancylobacter sp. 3268]MDR6955757.1 peptidoglycan/LPS O-acetylase OafA/YrhL [Ancylobacter sp. 3268]